MNIFDNINFKNPFLSTIQQDQNCSMIFVGLTLYNNKQVIHLIKFTYNYTKL